jgi:hypothetical protein
MLLKVDFAELLRGGVSLIPGFQSRQRFVRRHGGCGTGCESRARTEH